MRSLLVPLLSVLSIDFLCVEERLEADFFIAAAVFGSATVMPLWLGVFLLLVALVGFFVVEAFLVGVFLVEVPFLGVCVVGFLGVVGFGCSFACKGEKAKDNTIKADSVLVKLIQMMIC